MFKSLIASLVFVFSVSAFAIDEGDIRVGVIGGNISALGDIGNNGQNALGGGAIFSYLIASDLAFNLSYLLSSHDGTYKLKHSDLSVGVDYYTGGDGTVAYYVSGGAGLLSNKLTYLATDYSASAMALYLGGGLDFQVRSNFLFGLKFKYNKAFDATTTGVPFKTVQDTINVLATVSLVFGAK